jgi:hypothetical protein
MLQLLRKSEADEEHLFLNMLKSKKRLDDEESLTHRSDRMSDSGASTSRLSHTMSQASLRTPVVGSHSCTASNSEADEEEY